MQSTPQTLGSVTAYELKLAWPLGAFFFVFFLAPLILLFFVSLYTDTAMAHFGLTQYAKFLLDPFSLKVLGSTLWLGVQVTALCLLLGVPLAWLFVRVPSWVPGGLMPIWLLPLLTSVVVRTFAWIVILGRQGIVNTMLINLGIIDVP